ncbi:MAG: hypothetical protein C0409_08555 [Novosphingobium sp.]|nr:hypothetical protein [Novosphingobium sp.]
MERRLTGLDGLRGIAALVVLVMHVSSGLQGGHLAVDFFFMLSGYVMARAYEARLGSGDVGAVRFVIARFRRFWPTMALAATAGLIAAILADGPSPALAMTFLAALLLVPSGSTVPYLLNLPAWSIFYELLANAAHAFGLSRLRTGGLIVLLVLAGSGLGIATALHGYPRILARTTLTMQALVLFRLLFSYIAGIVIFRLFKDKPPVRLPFALGAMLLPAYVALVAIWPVPGWQFPFIVVIAPIMIICGLDERAPHGLSVILGKMSFPLYALHFPIMQLAILTGIRNPLLVIAASMAASALWLVPWRHVARSKAPQPIAAHLTNCAR